MEPLQSQNPEPELFFPEPDPHSVHVGPVPAIFGNANPDTDPCSNHRSLKKFVLTNFLFEVIISFNLGRNWPCLATGAFFKTCI